VGGHWQNRQRTTCAACPCVSVVVMISLLLVVNDLLTDYFIPSVCSFLNIQQEDWELDSEFHWQGGGGWNGWREVNIGDWSDSDCESEDSGVDF